MLSRKASQSYIDYEHRSIVAVPLNEDALQDEVRKLKSETQGFQHQSEILRSQSKSIIGFCTRASQASAAFEASISRQTSLERQQIFFLVSNVVEYALQQLKSPQKNETESKIQQAVLQTQTKLDKYSKTVSSVVQEKLNADDRTLAQLAIPALLHELDNPMLKSQSQSMLDAIQRATVLHLRSHLDRTYLTELSTPSIETIDSLEQAVLKQAQDDLQSLYIEIEDISAMLIDHEHGRKIRALETSLVFSARERAVTDSRRVSEENFRGVYFR